MTASCQLRAELLQREYLQERTALLATAFYSVVQAGLKFLVMLLPQFSKGKDYRHDLQHTVIMLLLMCHYYLVS